VLERQSLLLPMFEPTLWAPIVNNWEMTQWRRAAPIRIGLVVRNERAIRIIKVLAQCFTFYVGLFILCTYRIDFTDIYNSMGDSNTCADIFHTTTINKISISIKYTETK
jgi:hypothetical protein